MVTTFSKFQATFPLISPKVFGIFTPRDLHHISPQKSPK